MAAESMDLEKVSGLPLHLDATGRLVVQPWLGNPVPSVRTLEEVRPVLLDADAAGPSALYFMYRDLCLSGDREEIAAAGLRYDITVIPPGTIGREYVKTAGHYHPRMPGHGETYGEIYGVLSGRALFLFQKVSEQGRVLDVRLIEAGEGEKVVIPSGYGHITVNIGAGPLVMANWVDPSFQAVYAPLRDCRGGVYYVVSGASGPSLVSNPAYVDVPSEPSITPARSLRDGIPEGPLYALFHADRAFLEAVARPHEEPA